MRKNFLLVVIFSITALQLIASNAFSQIAKKTIAPKNLDLEIENSQIIQQQAKPSKDVVEANLADKSIDKKNNKLSKNIETKNSEIKASELANTLLGNSGFVNRKIASLMFDDEEINDIDRALDSFRNGQVFSSDKDTKNSNKKNKIAIDAQENQKSYIYLASIIYYSPKDWSVWINNTKITSENNSDSKELFVKEIYPDHAKIVWSLSVTKWKILLGKKADNLTPKINAKNNVEISFILKQNQTFILGSNRVVEGRAVNNLTK